MIARHHNGGELIGYDRNPAVENLIRRKRPQKELLRGFQKKPAVVCGCEKAGPNITTAPQATVTQMGCGDGFLRHLFLNSNYLLVVSSRIPNRV